MSNQPSFAQASAGLTAAHDVAREEALQADNDALVRSALAAQTGRRMAEEALRRQTEALALAAHELRNPLMPIRTVAALLGNATNLDQLPRLGAVIERQVMHMTRVIDDLLDAARAATGKLHVDRTLMDLRLQTFELYVPDRPLGLEGDLVRLTQVFANIVNNASKYTPLHGAIALDCRVSSRGAGPGEVVVVVADNGIGISREALPMIWEPFVQDPLAIGFSKEGLGIGLTLVRELVQAHAGSVAAASAGEGQGSAFTVRLPLA